MFPQRRMTTDTPDGNYSQALNLFVRGEGGWVQMPSRSISLNDYMKQLIKAHNADIDTEGTPEEFALYEHLFDGPETIEGLLAEHYTLSWALASLRDKLKHYEDALIPEIMPEGLQTIDRAIGTYGKDAQLTKAVEEMSELTKREYLNGRFYYHQQRHCPYRQTAGAERRIADYPRRSRRRHSSCIPGNAQRPRA